MNYIGSLCKLIPVKIFTLIIIIRMLAVNPRVPPAPGMGPPGPQGQPGAQGQPGRQGPPGM